MIKYKLFYTLPVSQTYTVIYKWAVMIKICNTSITNSAMFSS